MFLDLADLPPAERERVFRERLINAELRAEVESLLDYDSTNRERLPDLVSGAATELLPSKDDRLGACCGQFRIVRLLGSGGMGHVYLAERTDGEIQQQVAIKLLGFQGRYSQWRGRFLKERRMLATLNHPSIVKVVDAGHTEDGQPYLAMKYVEGTPIDVYAEGIGERERLQLFLHVCEGGVPCPRPKERRAGENAPPRQSPPEQRIEHALERASR
ncbi:MAG: protein kinase [Bryobacterales bacterium]|nr:protein kinase [Bryobacterales bacterium]